MWQASSSLGCMLGVVIPKLLLLVHALLITILLLKGLSYPCLNQKELPISAILYFYLNLHYNRHMTFENNFQLLLPLPSPQHKMWLK